MFMLSYILYFYIKFNAFFEMEKILQGLFPYTERHFQRVDQLLQKSCIIDFTLERMNILTPSEDIMESETWTNGEIKEDEDEEEIVVTNYPRIPDKEKLSENKNTKKRKPETIVESKSVKKQKVVEEEEVESEKEQVSANDEEESAKEQEGSKKEESKKEESKKEAESKKKEESKKEIKKPARVSNSNANAKKKRKSNPKK